MDKRTLREALDAYATHRLPANTDLWPAIRRRVQARPPRRGATWPAIRPAIDGPGSSDSHPAPAPRVRPRRALAFGAIALETVTLIAVVAVVLALVASGMASRRNGGAIGPGMRGTPTLAAPPPAQPYPVPADCPITPLRGPEERQGFTGYWIEDNGVALGTADGVLYQGLTEARSIVELTDVTGRLGDNPPVDLRTFGRRDELGLGVIWFPNPGCWTIEARGRADWLSNWQPFAITVYVYPIACPRRSIPDGDPGPIGPSLPCRPTK